MSQESVFCNTIRKIFLVFPQPFVGIGDLCPSVGDRGAVFIHADEDHFFDREDTFLGDLIAGFAFEGEGGTAEVDGFDPQLDDIALAGGVYKIDLGDEFGDAAGGAQLDDGIDCGLFVDPAEEAASEQGTVCVEVFGFDPFTGVEIHGAKVGSMGVFEKNVALSHSKTVLRGTLSKNNFFV